MEQARQVLMQAEESENLAQLFKALGDSSRLKILFQIFSSESCVNVIAQSLKMSEAAVSHHLRILRMNSLSGAAETEKRSFISWMTIMCDLSLRRAVNMWKNFYESTSMK